MASSVFYKFASRKDESRVAFDGTGISVFDLKRDIILANNMGKANDFDLVVTASDTKEEYKDDSQIIPRSSFVIVKRIPSARPGKGKASMYIAGAGNVVPTSEPVSRFGGAYKGAMSKRFDHKDESSGSKAPPSAPTSVKSNVANEDEAAAMAAMFQAQNAVWEETQEKMSHATPIIRNTRGTGGFRGGKPHMPQQSYQPERPLPASYVCYRCGQKGHWIKDCPTNSDREFDNKPRLKRTTGIPRSMLKAVEGPQGQLAQGVMVTPEGGYVVAQPDSVSWQRQVSRKQGITAAEVRERPPSDLSLACPIDNKLLRDAVSTPCCGTVYCEDCIQTHLLERDFICPNCSKKIASLDKLIADKPTRTKVNDYIEKAIEESKKDGEEEDDTNKAGQSSEQDPNSEQDFYSDQQPGMNMDMIVESIPQLQAQISQISAMLQNSSLPNHVRQQTEMHHQQLNMQLQQAQTISATMAAVASFQQQQQQMQQQVQNNPMGFNMQQGWTNPYSNQQPAGQDSPYQRLPVNNRRRNLKRERPSDFLEIGGENDAKVQRFWE